MIIARAAEDLDARARGIRRNDDMIVAAGLRDRQCHGGERALATVRELQQPDDPIDVAGGIDERQPILTARDDKHDIAIGIAPGGHILERDIRPEFDRRKAIETGGAFDAVVAVAAPEADDIIAAIARDKVVPGPADEDLGGARSDEMISPAGAGATPCRRQVRE